MWALFLLLAAAVAGGLAAPWVAARGGRKPVVFDVDAEATVVAGVWRDPSRWAYCAELAPTDFASGTWRGVWDAMSRAGHVLAGVVDSDAAADVAAATLASNSASFLASVRSTVSDRDAMLLDSLAYPSDEDVMSAAQTVMASRMERVNLTGASIVVPSSTPDSIRQDTPPVVRVPAPVTKSRVLVSAFCAAAWAGTSWALVQVNGVTGFASWLTVAAWLVLGVGMFVVAFVDFDTMYIDMPFWSVCTAAAWVLAVAAAAAASDLSKVIAGAVMVVAVAVVFEGLNLVYRVVRGRDGQGFGDTLIIIGTVGIPPALTGQWSLGYVSVMAAMLAAIAAWAVVRLRGLGERDTPFAFGPWLALGPLVALWWAAYGPAL